MAKILIVDDDHEVMHVIRQLLTVHRYDTRTAPNGLAGLQLFQTQFFDLIITDLHMPCMDGISFLREVKQLDPAMPVIILTAYASLKAAVETMGNGSLTYLSKPFEKSELLNAVQDIVGHGKK